MYICDICVRITETHVAVVKEKGKRN